MATPPTAPVPSVNSNAMDLSKYRGEIKPCPHCRPDDALTARVCSTCLGHHFVSECLNCAATGQFKGTTVWDGGENPHVTTCNPCGGTGYFPVRKPSDWDKTHPAVTEPSKHLSAV